VEQEDADVRGLVAEDFLEERVRTLQHCGREPDEALRGLTAAE